MNTPHNILVVHVAGLGRTVLALPALEALRRHLPDARITVATSAPQTGAAELLRMSGYVDAVLPVGRLRGAEALAPSALYHGFRSLGQIRRERYDVSVEFAKGTESSVALRLAGAQQSLDRKTRPLDLVIQRVSESLLRKVPSRHVAHEYLKRLEPLGVRPTSAEPRLQSEAAFDEQVERRLRKANVRFGELLIGLHAGAGANRPRWPLARFASIAARMIHNFNARVLLFAGPRERGSAKRVLALLKESGADKRAVAIESPKLPEFASFASRLSLFVGNHSGPAHLAAALGVPAVVPAPALEPTTIDLLEPRAAHIRAPHIDLIAEEAVYEAACRLLKMNRAEYLRAR